MRQKETCRFALLAHGASVDPVARQEGRRVHLEMACHGRLRKEVREYSLTAVRRALGLDVDTSALLSAPKGIGRRYERLVRGGVGSILETVAAGRDNSRGRGTDAAPAPLGDGTQAELPFGLFRYRTMSAGHGGVKARQSPPSTGAPRLAPPVFGSNHSTVNGPR